MMTMQIIPRLLVTRSHLRALCSMSGMDIAAAHVLAFALIASAGMRFGIAFGLSLAILVWLLGLLGVFAASLLAVALAGAILSHR